MKKIFYLHIPKTGGQTLSTRLASAFPYGKTSILNTRLGEGDKRKLVGMLSKYDFIESHVSGKLLSSFKNLDILITVRNPVHQIISHYLHIRRAPEHPFYRPASELTPNIFFDKYSDIITNRQSRNLVNSLVGPKKYPHEADFSEMKYLTEHLFEALKKVRWSVPTEEIDDFVSIWEIENKLRVPIKNINVNVSYETQLKDELSSLVLSRPEFFSLDQLLWQTVKENYVEYKNHVLELKNANSPFDHPNWL